MNPPFVYPSLPARHDLGLMRFGGAGLGNCLYVYFAAFVLAHRFDCPLVAPQWSHWRLAAMLRGETDLRRYGQLLRAAPDELVGTRRIAALAALLRRHETVATGHAITTMTQANAPVRVVIGDYVFDGLGAHRAAIRARLCELIREPLPKPTRWAQGGYAAVHVRLGDFAQATEEPGQRDEDNRRIGFAWYTGVLRALRQTAPGLPVRLFSDGTDAELAPLLGLPGVTRAPALSATSDLLGLAGASLLVGSNSTFSRWAAFLGDMPSIWRARPGQGESPVSVGTPLLVINNDFDAIARLPVMAQAS